MSCCQDDTLDCLYFFHLKNKALVRGHSRMLVSLSLHEIKSSTVLTFKKLFGWLNMDIFLYFSQKK